MSCRRVTRLLVLVVAVGAVLPLQATPAAAFTEGSINNFFGTNAGNPGLPGANNSFFGGSAGDVTTASGNSFFGAFAGLSNTAGADNAFFGHDAGFSNSTGSANAFFGKAAGRSNATACCNAFFGHDAGFSNTEGAANVFLGSSAGVDNATGSNNTFVGRLAGGNNTTGSNNAFLGSFAGQGNTTGLDNTFVGQASGSANSDGVSNAFVGRLAGAANSSGSDNTFLGRSAGAANTTASENTFVGAAAGEDNTTGEDNTFLGRFTGANNTTGSDNVFLGQASGQNNTVGAQNTFVGPAAGFTNSTGAENTFVGRTAGLSNSSENANTFLGARSNGAAGISNATAVGHRAQVLQANSLILGSINGLNGATSDVRVGIGTPTPADPLHVRRGDGTAKILVEEASATLEGRELFQLTNNGAARFRVRNTSNNATWDFQSSSGGGSFVIDRVGGPVSLDFELQPDGDLVLRGTATATSFITSSDRNLKTDITPAKASKLMTLLRELDISTWRFKNQPEGTVNLGPMAQDFHHLFGMGTQTTIDVRDLAALALVAAQVLDEENEELGATVADQAEMLADVQDRLTGLEAAR